MNLATRASVDATGRNERRVCRLRLIQEQDETAQGARSLATFTGQCGIARAGAAKEKGLPPRHTTRPPPFVDECAPASTGGIDKTRRATAATWRPAGLDGKNSLTARRRISHKGHATRVTLVVDV